MLFSENSKSQDGCWVSLPSVGQNIYPQMCACYGATGSAPKPTSFSSWEQSHLFLSLPCSQMWSRSTQVECCAPLVGTVQRHFDVTLPALSSSPSQRQGTLSPRDGSKSWDRSWISPHRKKSHPLSRNTHLGRLCKQEREFYCVRSLNVLSLFVTAATVTLMNTN